MAGEKITQKILILKRDEQLSQEMKFPKETEFEIVRDIVYMGGYPLPPGFQRTVYNWLVANMNDRNMFYDDKRRFK